MKRLLLVGGGHAHLEVIRTLRQLVPDDVEVSCVDPNRRALYSGMIPSVIAGSVTLDDAGIDLAALCGRSGVQLTTGRVTSLQLDDRGGTATVVADDRETQRAFDVVSINCGAVSRAPFPRDERTLVLSTKPIDSLMAGLAAIDQAPGPIVVVGGGAGGVEVAFALRARFDVPITISAPELLGGHSRAARRRVDAALRARCIDVIDEQIVALEGGDAITAQGRPLPARAAILAAGVVAPPWVESTGLALDAAGFICVEPTLRSTRHDRAFAAGDVASVVGRPLPKAGVYAVRAGPILARNLAAVLAGRAPVHRFEPRRWALALISSGPGNATLSYGPLGFSGRVFWQLKNRIDRRFLARYRAAADSTST